MEVSPTITSTLELEEGEEEDEVEGVRLRGLAECTRAPKVPPLPAVPTAVSPAVTAAAAATPASAPTESFFFNVLTTLIKVGREVVSGKRKMGGRFHSGQSGIGEVSWVSSVVVYVSQVGSQNEPETTIFDFSRDDIPKNYRHVEI